MSAFIPSLNGNRASGRPPADGAIPLRKPAANSSLPLTRPVADARNAQPGSWRYSSQLNDQLTAAQRSMNFVDQLLDQLEGVKGDLSRQLTHGKIDQDALKTQLASVRDSWQRRAQKCGGSLDANLRFQLNGDARKTFTLRGLDMLSLREGGGETLVFYVGENANAPASISVGEGLSEEEVLRRFNRGLGQAGLRVSLNDKGALVFSVDEAAWSGMRDRMSANGGGIRLPSGVPQRLRPEEEADALQGMPWKTNDHAEVRRSLQHVIRSIAIVQQARAAIKSAMDEARHSIEQLSRMDEQSWARSFVDDFNAKLNLPDSYQQVFEVIPALVGVSRHRVLSLLALR